MIADGADVYIALPGGDARRSIIEIEYFAEFGFRIYNEDRVSDSRSLRESLAAGTRIALPRLTRSEGADGNVRASRVGKGTHAGVAPACLFPFVEKC